MNSKLKVFLHGILPAFLLAASVGQIYAFTNFSTEISAFISVNQSVVQFAFSLGIFFLGMGAAFFGPIVEKNIKKSAMIGIAFFIIGLIVTQISVVMHSVALLWIGYGLLLGLGTGIIYVTPVKTMMLWLPKWKAVAAALPIIFFGLGSTFSTMIYAKIGSVGIDKVFMIYAVIYAVAMVIGGFLLKKPEGAEVKLQSMNEGFSYRSLLKERFFIHSWLFMFLNITAGLCLIPLSKQLMNDSHIAYATTTIALIIALCGVFNGCGRFFFALLSDKLELRLNIVFIILIVSIISMIWTGCFPILIGITLLVINACYGAGFSVIPAILSEKFGMSNISKIHGAVLSAWGVAGLCGNQLSIFMKSHLGFYGVICAVGILYILNMINFNYWTDCYNLQTEKTC